MCVSLKLASLDKKNSPRNNYLEKALIITFRWFICRTLGVRSLANASRARQFNPLNPSWGGVGTASSNKYGSRARSCSVVRGRAWSCVVVRGRAWSCVVMRAWSVIRGRAWSCAVGRARSCVVVPFCPLRGQHCRDTNERRNERTNNI